jgi:hypothetical protein
VLELGVSGARPMLSTVMNPASEYSITGDGTGEARRSRSPRYSSDSHKGAVYKFGRGGKGAASLQTHLWTQSHSKMYYYFLINPSLHFLMSGNLDVLQSVGISIGPQPQTATLRRKKRNGVANASSFPNFPYFSTHLMNKEHTSRFVHLQVLWVLQVPRQQPLLLELHELQGEVLRLGFLRLDE